MEVPFIRVGATNRNKRIWLFDPDGATNRDKRGLQPGQKVLISAGGPAVEPETKRIARQKNKYGVLYVCTS